MRRLFIRAGLAVACLPLLVGCGGGGSGDGSARQAAQTYVDAHNSRDFTQLCDMLSDRFRNRLGGSDCPHLIEQRTSGEALRPLKLVSVRTGGAAATATIQSSTTAGDPTLLTLVFRQESGKWRLAGF